MRAWPGSWAALPVMALLLVSAPATPGRAQTPASGSPDLLAAVGVPGRGQADPAAARPGTLEHVQQGRAGFGENRQVPDNDVPFLTGRFTPLYLVVVLLLVALIGAWARWGRRSTRGPRSGSGAMRTP